MRVPLFRFGALMICLAAGASAQMERAELAALRQDVMLLTQRVGELSMTVEQLTRENGQLQAQASRNYATIDQLNKAIAEVNRALQLELGEQKREILTQVAGQLEKLGKQTNAALDALAKNQATRPVVQSTFSDDFPKEGLNYTVQSGDTLGEIARKHGARLQDILNANKIADPTKIRVGQTIFIPLAK